MGGLLGMVLALAVLGIANWILPANSAIVPALTMVCFLVYTTTFNSTWGPVLWVVLGEIFPLRIRGLALGVAALVNWLAAYAVSLTFPPLLSGVGPGPAFLLYAVIGLLIAPILFRVLPETHRRSLEDIESMLRGGRWRERTTADAGSGP